MHFHWQNLNEDRDGNAKGWPWHGRAWLNVGDWTFRFSWNFWTHFIHAYIDADASEREIGAALAFMPIAFWFSVSSPTVGRLIKLVVPRRGARSLSLSAHDGALWWRVWADPDSWTSGTPRWRDGSFNVVDFLLGRPKYSERTIEVRDVVVPLPERGYRATVTVEERTHKRPRWFARRRIGTYVKLHDGEQIPIPGKGENAWDCGDDAIYAQSSPSRSVEDAVGHLVSSVLTTRQRRSGTHAPPGLRAVA